MNNRDIAVRPWPEREQCERVPEHALFVCTYALHIGVDSIDEDLYLERAEGKDRLWVSNLSGEWCAVEAPSEGQLLEACTALVDARFRSQVGHGWPIRVRSPGLLDEALFLQIRDALKRELDENAARAKAGKTEIVEAAERLGLSPEPAGTGSDHWRARCPGTNHGLKIQAGIDTFWCGYCNRKGGPRELEAFVAERRPGQARGSRSEPPFP